MEPRVSVLVPVHDALPWLEPALRSVAGQTLSDFEAICLDDGSTDGSGAVLAGWAERDPRFRVLRPGRVGLVAALNALVAAARAPYLARFDGDDAMHPRRLELQAAWLDAHPRVGVVSSLVRHFPRDCVRGGNRVYEEWMNGLVTPEDIAREMLVESPVAHPSVMIRAGLVESLGGYRDDGLPEDYDLWLRAWLRGVRFAKVPRVLLYWREHAARLTRTHGRYALEPFLKAKARALAAGPLADGRRFVVWGAGMTGRRLVRQLLRVGRRPAAVLDVDPRKIGRTRHGVPVVPPEALRAGSALVLAAVGARGARARIREALRSRGLVETRDFWMVA